MLGFDAIAAFPIADDGIEAASVAITSHASIGASGNRRSETHSSGGVSGSTISSGKPR